MEKIPIPEEVFKKEAVKARAKKIGFDLSEDGNRFKLVEIATGKYAFFTNIYKVTAFLMALGVVKSNPGMFQCHWRSGFTK